MFGNIARPRRSGRGRHGPGHRRWCLDRCRQRRHLARWLPALLLVLGPATAGYVLPELRTDSLASLRPAGSALAGRGVVVLHPDDRGADPNVLVVRPQRVAETGSFRLCAERRQANCVIDGDTIRYGGVKIRLADIDTPEVFSPRCAFEASLGARATRRLLELLNAGPIALAPAGRDEDRYGRKLRVVVRDGRSLGEVLVAEGLARRWDGRRRSWCG